ncbi:MAG: sigma-70 family RNA polymerase sigma factor [Anaerolineae bacterium]|nr:sigma-70 family RNA polymerase sigma factor [Anaerolineae bacterium]
MAAPNEGWSVWVGIEMEPRVSDELYSQCLQRVRAHFTQHSESVSVVRTTNAAHWLFDRVKHNIDRVPVNVPCHPITGIPNSYIDEIIHYVTAEGSRVVALKIGQAETWNKMLDLVMRRVYTSLRRYNTAQSDLENLAGELIQHCACLIWEAIDRYHYDSSLDAWVSRLVTYEVACTCRSSQFRHDSTSLSLESPLPGETDRLTLIEMLSDDRAERELGVVDTWLILEAGWNTLSMDQQEVVRRRLLGEGIASIANAMGRSPNAIYKLQQRASASLQLFAGQ